MQALTRPQRAVIEDVTGAEIRSVAPLSGGSIGEVVAVTVSTGARIVAKLGPADAALPAPAQARPAAAAQPFGSGQGLALEGWMLTELRRLSALPVPAVLYAADGLLLLEWLPSDGRITAAVQRHAADLLAALHGITAPRYGFARDTLLGGLVQPNAWCDDWRTFFAERRLLHMAEQAARTGRLPSPLAARIERIAARLGDWLAAPNPPGLVHGDLWTGNVLCRDGRVTGFVDPAIYYADPEVELAFSTLFATFGPAFFERYDEHRPVAPGFFEARRDLYNIYPLLVHVRLFGAGYLGQLTTLIDRFD